MSEPRRHHTVPQMYLRGFADDNERLWEYAKPNGRSTQKHIEKVSVEKDFYALERNGELDQSLERLNSQLEDRAAPSLKRLIADEDITDRDRYEIATSFAYMYVRTPTFRRCIANMMSAFVRANFAAATNDDEALESYLKNFIKDSDKNFPQRKKQLKKSLRHPELMELSVSREYTLLLAWQLVQDIGEELFAMNWSVVEAQAQAFFISSDNPVVLGAYPAKIAGRGLGFSSPEAFVTVPITPKLCWVATRQQPERRNHIPATASQVDVFNKFRASRAERYIYADRDSSAIQKLVAKFPNAPQIIHATGLGQDKDFSRVKVPRKKSKK